MYGYKVFRTEVIPGSLEDFRALMHELYELQPEVQEDRLMLQGEQTPSDYPRNRARWEVTLGGTFQQRGYVIARQLSNGATELKFAYYSKYQPIGQQFEEVFVNRIIQRSSLEVESVSEESKSIGIVRRKLHQNLIHHFNKEELRTLAFEMGIQHEDFSDQLNSFARELIVYCERHQRIEDLTEICQRERPQIIW